ncbi:MAG: hypothetical protein DRR16_01990 [Candidatus Parabeggiatoa sp. nov. 3]|nr:MAG: hypothetical protein DRR00_19200 [Gammaproteobacteria bacterium]RKZ64732.1 MAG: hypothetical protein DRQ99_14810 [Gammaproteobacteria bacterium]RKZ89695.1 MAG: hypothetical protein DRR16_01990 [Gammaproteobacteria bacterium]
MKKSILVDNSYTFSDYFKLPYSTKDIVAEFDYQFKLKQLTLPKKEIANLRLDQLRTTFYKKLPHISLNSEAAKREFFISPLLLELLNYLDFEIDVEYPLKVNDKLKGNIDYFIHSKTDFIIIEAKNADMEKGFTQLAVELIAIEQYLEDIKDNFLYGVVTMGNIWQFGLLDRQKKMIFKDIDAFVIPADLEKLFTVFFGIFD